MINIESALRSGDMLAIGFDCAADSPEEVERALKIQSEFQVLFGTYHNNNNNLPHRLMETSSGVSS